MTETGIKTQTDYLAGGFQYKVNELQFFPHPEGYVNVIDNKYNYVFNYTDHLGNIRVSYGVDPSTSTLKVLEENHYYPFGLKHEGYNMDYKMYQKIQSGAIAIRLAAPLQPNYLYRYNGKELQNELNLNVYDYGARNYDPALGRWMNIDPLASKYSSITPYAYVVNNPIFFLDPDGMRIRNGDEIKRIEAEKSNEEWQKSLASKAEYLGISVNASRREWKKAAITKEGQAEWERTQNIRNAASDASDALNKYTRASAKSEEKINELKTDAPLLFERMDALSTDIYIQSVNHLGNNDGQNETWFNETDPNNISLKSEFSLNSTLIKTVNNPSGGRTTLEVSQHELGHADYIIENTQIYYQWIKDNNINTRVHDGHANGDASGVRATQFGPRNFKRR